MENTNKPKVQVISYPDEDTGDAIVKIEWSHFTGSVLDMEDEYILYDKEQMIKDELKAVKKEHDYAFYKTADMFPRRCWGEIVEQTSPMIEKLEKALGQDKTLQNNYKKTPKPNF